MNKEELVANLGTIARSGSKVCFHFNMFVFTQYTHIISVTH